MCAYEFKRLLLVPLRALSLSVKHAKERRSREKSDAFFVFDFFPFKRMGKEGIKRAGRRIRYARKNKS